MEPNDKKILPKVLICDDDTDLLDMLAEIFSKNGFKVVTAIDGVDGTFKFSNEVFDLVVTDLKMPKRDGIKLVQQIQSADLTPKVKGAKPKPTPIILISASVDDYRADLELLGPLEIIHKPFSPAEVVERAKKLLEKKINISAGPVPGMVNCKAGDYLITEGDKSSEAYFVKEGTLRILKKGLNGAEVEIGQVGAGEIVGEMGFASLHGRSASVQAVSDCALVSIPKDKIDAVINGQPKWFKVFVETICNRLEETTKQLAEEKSKGS